MRKILIFSALGVALLAGLAAVGRKCRRGGAAVY